MTGVLFFAGSAKVGLDAQSLTNGVSGFFPSRQIGFMNATFGAINPATSAIYGGAQIVNLYFDEAATTLWLTLQGARANSGWTTLTIGGTNVFNRAAATYSSGGTTYWTWLCYASPFGVNSGDAVSIVWA